MTANNERTHAAAGGSELDAGTGSTLSCELLRDGTDFASLWPAIAALRSACRVEDEVLLDPVHFLAATSNVRPSCSVACLDGRRLVGILFATEHRVCGVRTGYAVGGDFSGRGLLLCREEDEEAVLRAAAACLFANGIHSLELRSNSRSRAAVALPGVFVKQFQETIHGDRLHLGRDYEGLLQALKRHARQNVRYYTRRTMEQGIRFEAAIPEQEFLRERARLNRSTRFPISRLHLHRDDRLLGLHGGERMGLRAADGKLVALVCGFTARGCFHLLTQWNDPAHQRLSLSAVLRGYLMEELIRRGERRIFFMGCTSLTFASSCEPQPYRLLLLERQGGWQARIKRLSARYCRWCSNRHRVVSPRMARVAGAFLSDGQIAERTALNHTVSPRANTVGQKNTAS